LCEHETDSISPPGLSSVQHSISVP
jgi:hypothetical protein